MTTRRDKAKPHKPQPNKQLEAAGADSEKKPQQGVNQRQEKLANFLIDVAKYVFTGVIITSLFNDVEDKTMLYVIGMLIVVFSLWGGIMLTNKRKDK